MRNNNFERRNGWIYSNKSLKYRIDNNKYVRDIRKKLMDKKIQKYLPKKPTLN
ncbi:MAG: hypothetical protein ACTSRI_05820 [Promethearchaeota archaeon]